MAFDEPLESDWLYELPFYIMVLAAYLILFSINPSLRWGDREPSVDSAVKIEFVAAAPAVPPKPLATPVRAPRGAPVKPARPAKPVVVSKTTPAEIAARAEQARLAARAQAEARIRAAEKARETAQARAEAARVERERLAAVRAEKARKKADLSRELAAMPDPDVTIAAAGAAPAISKGLGRKAAAALAAGESSLSDAALPAPENPELLDSRSGKGAAAAAPGEVSYALDGPVGDRRVIERVLPQSPDWVGARGLDLMVTIRFQVLPDGRVKPGAVIEKTSGFPEIDRRALKAIRQWIFEAAPADAPQTWGRVVLRFLS